jgi:hypothetical protein
MQPYNAASIKAMVDGPSPRARRGEAPWAEPGPDLIGLTATGTKSTTSRFVGKPPCW